MTLLTCLIPCLLSISGLVFLHVSGRRWEGGGRSQMEPFVGAQNGQARAAVLKYDQQVVVLHQDHVLLCSWKPGYSLVHLGMICGGSGGTLLFGSQNFRYWIGPGMGRGREEAGENAAEEQQLGKSSANFWGGLLFLTEAKPNDSPFSNLCSSLKNGQTMTLASFHHASLDKGHFLLITLVAQCPLTLSP